MVDSDKHAAAAAAGRGLAWSSSAVSALLGGLLWHSATETDSDSDAPRFERPQEGLYRRIRRHPVTRLALLSTVLVWIAVLLIGLLQRPEVKTCAFVDASLGLGCEEHMAATRDGYSLFLKRVPRHGAPPVLLLAGVLDSSAGFVVSGPKDSLAGVLHARGMDVWLLEQRGRAPWRHEKFTGQDLEFWDFSLDETVSEDIPALVDYVRRFTGRPVASIVGHGEGGVMAALAAVEEPDMVGKHVKSIVAVGAPFGVWAQAAAARERGERPQSILALAPRVPQLLIDYVHPGVLWGLTRIVTTGACSVVPGVCAQIACALGGCTSVSRIDLGLAARMLSCYPRETSLKVVQHLSQLAESGRLERFDHGPEENARRYGGSERPPAYDLKALRTPLALIYGENDTFVPPSSHMEAMRILPHEAVRRESLDGKFGRADFAWARGAHAKLFADIVDFIEEHV